MKFGGVKKEVIPVILYILQTEYYVQAENHLEYLVWEENLKKLKRHGHVVKAHITSSSLSQFCVSQHSN